MQVGELAAAIRAEVDALPGRRGVGRPYPNELRERILGYCQLRREQEASWAEITREVGIGLPTLRNWMSTRHARAIEIKPSGFERIEIAPETIPRRQEFVVHGPSGLRIDGLDIEQLADLIWRLS